MAHKSYCYQFSEQKVFAPENSPICFQIKENLIIVAMDNYTIIIYDVSGDGFNMIKTIPVCGSVIKLDFCLLDDYIITLESKNNNEVGNRQNNNNVRTYLNWRNGDSSKMMRSRTAHKSRNNAYNMSNQTILSHFDKHGTSIEVLEFIDISNPLCFALYTKPTSRRSYTNINQVYEELSSVVCISENTYVHFYRLSYQKLNGDFSITGTSKSFNKTPDLSMEAHELYCCFQHMYTVNFSFIVRHIGIHSQIVVAASKEKVQAIHLLEEKQKLEKYSNEYQSNCASTTGMIDMEIEKCWLTSISNARKHNAQKSKSRPREILGPTQNLDTASITMLRYPDKQMTFETLLYRKYLNTTSSVEIKDLLIVKVEGFEEYGLFILRQKEIVQYSFHLKSGDIVKIAEYDFKDESAVAMTFSDQANLLHVAFSNGDLVTYNSLVCSVDLFETSDIAKKVALTKLNKVRLMGLKDLKSNGNLVLACCKFNMNSMLNPNSNSTDGAQDFYVCDDDDSQNSSRNLRKRSWISYDSWNFYLFKQPNKEELKQNIINHADYKGAKKLLQMLLCSLLAFPNQEELNYDMIERLIICCLRTETIYSEVIPYLLLRDNLSISKALSIFQTTETKELYDKNLFKYYTKKKLMNANLSNLTEDQFRWIILKILDCSVNILFEFFVTNQLYDFLKADLLVIEGLKIDSFESALIKILYYTAHGEYDMAEPLVSTLDETELLHICVNQPHLLYFKQNHTSFGWFLNFTKPQLYAKIVAWCHLDDSDIKMPFKDLDVIKEVGQCSYILCLEEIVNTYVQNTEYITFPNNNVNTNVSPSKQNPKIPVLSNFHCQTQSYDIINRSAQNNISCPTINSTDRQYASNSDDMEKHEQMYKYYMNLLILLYHEYSFNGVEFCPHKMKQNCKKIPLWLKNLRYNQIMNKFSPFDGEDPFIMPHTNKRQDNKENTNNNGNVCGALCCQSYLIRLQCLLSWEESWNMLNMKIISTSVESNDHPAWKSLNFLLLLSKTQSNLNAHQDVVRFIQSNRSPTCTSGAYDKDRISSKLSDNIGSGKVTRLTGTKDLLDCYLSQFGAQMPVSVWERIIDSEPASTSSPVHHSTHIDKYLEHAYQRMSLNNFCHLLMALRQTGHINNSGYYYWVELAGKTTNQNRVFDAALQKLIKKTYN